MLRVVGSWVQGFGSQGLCNGGLIPFIANPRKLEHGFRRIRARIPYTLP